MLLLIILLLLYFNPNQCNNQEDNHWFKRGSCRKLWRPDNLPGKCFGLKLHNEYEELKHLTTVTNAGDCRSLCCNIGDKCITWQYQNSSSECKLGPPVRLGSEGADTGDWCEPNPPGKWNGYRLISKSNNQCEWGEQLPNQCFGFGPEVMTNDNKRHTTNSCADACCQSDKCDMWQEMEGRGCYIGSKSSVWCDKEQGAFEGGRKCIP
eukprot:gene21053-27280_t